MKRIAVLPDLVLDDDAFQMAQATIAQCAPDVHLTREEFFSPKRWKLVADPENLQKFDVPWFKAEFIAKHGHPYHQTAKVNYWRGPDLRRDGMPEPHNHPWPFESYILRGWYQEDRYTLGNESNRNRILVDPVSSLWEIEGMSVSPPATYLAGDKNHMPLTTFHEVTKVKPGTLSVMICDLGRKEGWGHLVFGEGSKLVYEPVLLRPKDDRFKQMMRDLNPHLRKK